jgi:hypothetical protein
MKRIANSAVGLMLVLRLSGIPARAQNQTSSNTQSASSGQSLGDYARQVRKGPEQGGKAKVFDNDNLPKSDKLSIVGKAPAEATAETKPAEPAKAENAPATEAKPGSEAANAEAKPATPETTKKAPEDPAAKQTAAKQWEDKIDAQKQQIDLLTRELDVAQREYQLRAAAMYADAGNRLRNSADWDKQDAQYKQQIADKQKSIDDAKEKLVELQERARQAGMPESTQQQ